MFKSENLISALYKLSQEDFNVTDDTILDKLYFHISKCHMLRDNISSLLPMIGDWIEVVIKGWTDKNIFYGVKIFSVRFIGYVGSYSQGFTLLQDKNVFKFIKHLISSTDIQNDSCLMVPLISTCEMVLNHREGWEWITESMILKHVVKTIYDDRSIFTKRAGVKFISHLLTKSINYDADVGKEMINYVCKPLVLNHLIVLEQDQSSGEFNEDRKEGLIETTSGHTYDGNKIIVTTELVKASKLLCDIIENGYLNNAKLPMRFSLVYRLEGDIFDSVLAKDILDNCTSDQNHQTFSLLLIMIELSNLFSKDSLTCQQDCCLNQMYFHIHRIIKSLVSLGLLRNVVNFIVASLSWVAKVKQKITYPVNCPEYFCFLCYYKEPAIVNFMLQYFGDLSPVISHCAMVTHLQSHIDLDNCTAKMLTQALPTKYSSKHCTLYNTCHQYIELGLLGITRSLDFIKYSKTSRNVFMGLLFCLTRIVDDSYRDEELGKQSALHLLNVVNNLLEKRNLPLCFMDWLRISKSCGTFISYILRLLGKKAIDVRVTIISLQVLSKILKYEVMPYLLTYEDTVCPPILNKFPICSNIIVINTLDCKNWEVRDTAIELYQTAVDLAELTPWYFLNELSNTLLTKILKMATDDESAYVRASALQFFSKSVRCKFFDGIILPSTLLDIAIKTLLEDNMPTARISACNLIAALYINYVPAILNDADRIFDAVYLAFTKDLDWEVKVTALNFWQCTINKHLLDQRILYNQSVLPLQNLPVDTQETISRIVKVLDTVGEIGCLKAVWLGVTDDCDSKVSQEAQSIVESLEKLNEQWSFLEELKKVDNSHDSEKITEISYRRLTPKDFFSLLQKKSWREKIASRKKWIENTCDNLESLLDHILENDNRMDDWDHNAVDCY